jgi:small subunit ribosomal protein S6
MTLPAPTYDLVLLLDNQAEEGARAKIVADARASIEAQGELLRHDEWGERPLTYPIDRKANAEYHLLQFHSGAAELLSGLDRSLRITDGVLRFRIIKLKPGVPDAPEMPSASSPPAVRSEPVPEPQSEPLPESEPDAQPAVDAAADAPVDAAADVPVDAAADVPVADLA